MKNKKEYPIANQNIILREEFDDWAIIFDPDTGNTYTINPIGVMIFKLLNGKNKRENIIKAIKEQFDNVSNEINKDIDEFIENLDKQGFIGYSIV